MRRPRGASSPSGLPKARRPGIGEKGEARPIAEWRAAFAAVAEEVASADTAIRDAERKQRDIDREIARLEADRAAKPPSKLEVRIDLAAAAATKATLRVTYTVRNARWTPLYDARLDTGAKDRKPALELVRRAEITQIDRRGLVECRAGRLHRAHRARRQRARSELADRAVSASRRARWRAAAISDRRAPPAALGAGELAPRPRSGRRTRRRAAGGGRRRRLPGDVQDSRPRQPRRQRGRQEPARRPRATIAPDLAIRAAPVLDPTAFLEASFKQDEDAPLLPGRVAIYRDGVFVGRGQMAAAGKDETVRLGFGADDKVKIERTVVKRNEGSAGLIVTTSKTDERSFKTTVRNGHDFPIRIAIEDQLPVSENEDIQVEMLPSTTPPTATNLRDRRGVLEWAFEAKPGEVRDIAFAWRVRWPKDKGVVMMPAG